MASITLAEAGKLSLDMLISGIIEQIITVDQFYEMMPWLGIEGNSLAYNREAVLGDVQVLGVGGTITAKAPTTVTKVNSNLTTIIGDAEINGLIEATQSNIQDQETIQVAGKAKSAGRKYRDMLLNGTGAADQFSGLLSLVPAGQQVNTGTNGAVLSYDILDQLIDLVKDKDGQVDYIQMAGRTIRSYFALLRTAGGASIGEIITLPSGKQIPTYRGIPIFKNENMPTNQTKGATTTCTTILAGTFDDGSQKYGMSGLTARANAGLGVERVGTSQTKDEKITRVKWYCGLALFNELGIASAPGITN